MVNIMVSTIQLVQHTMIIGNLDTWLACLVCYTLYVPMNKYFCKLHGLPTKSLFGMVIEVFEYLRTKIKSDQLLDHSYTTPNLKSTVKRPLEPSDIHTSKKRITTQNGRTESKINGVETSEIEVIAVDTGESADVKVETIDTVSCSVEFYRRQMLVILTKKYH